MTKWRSPVCVHEPGTREARLEDALNYDEWSQRKFFYHIGKFFRYLCCINNPSDEEYNQNYYTKTFHVRPKVYNRETYPYPNVRHPKDKLSERLNLVDQPLLASIAARSPPPRQSDYIEYMTKQKGRQEGFATQEAVVDRAAKERAAQELAAQVKFAIARETREKMNTRQVKFVPALPTVLEAPNRDPTKFWIQAPPPLDEHLQRDPAWPGEECGISRLPPKKPTKLRNFSQDCHGLAHYTKEKTMAGTLHAMDRWL